MIDGAPAGPSAAAPPSVRVRVKWFNVEKGFGFVTPLDGQPEAFLHASTLSRGGVPRVGEGAELLCQIVDGPKGPQVAAIDEVLPLVEEPEEAATLAGSVKWYQPEKGFGFVVTEDGGRDIFLHKSVLKRAGLETIAAGQKVLVSVRDTAKGREARHLLMAPGETAEE